MKECNKTSDTIYKCLSLVIISSVPFIFSLNGDFVFDDSEAIVKNKDVTVNSFNTVFYNDFWGTSISSNTSHKSYRPLTIITFKLNYIFGNNTLIPYHFKICNLILHILCVIIVWYSFKTIRYGCYLFRKPPLHSLGDLEFMTAVLFAVHPVHTEAVSGIVGRADILAAITFFTSFLLYHNSIATDLSGKVITWFYLIMALLFAFLSMLFKENGITALGFCLTYELIVNPKVTLLTRGNKIVDKKKYPNCVTNKNFIFRLISLILSILLFLYMRWLVMGKSSPQFKAIDNPAAFNENFLSRVTTYNYIYFLNFLLFFWPQWLCFDWSMGCVPLIKEMNDQRIFFVILFYCYGILSLYYVLNKNIENANRRLVILGFISILISFLPAANIFFTVGFVLAERILYIPSAGYCFLIVIGFRNLASKRKEKIVKAYYFLFIYVILIYGIRTAQRSYDWRMEYNLFTTGLKVCPLNAKVHYNVAKVADANNQTDWAIAEYREAIRLNSGYYQAMNNLANLLKNGKKHNEAEKLLRTAISYKKDFPAAWMNLGIVLANKRQYEESEEAYLTALHYRNKYPDCYYNLGNLYLERNNTNDALEAWNKAITLNSKHVLAWSNLLALLDNTNQIAKALELIPVALNELPETPSIYFVAANIYGKIGQYDKAKHHFENTIRLLGNRAQAIHHANFGVLYHRWKKYKLAEEQYKEALKIDPNFKSAVNNMKDLKRILLSL